MYAIGEDVLSIGDQSITVKPAKYQELVPRLHGKVCACACVHMHMRLYVCVHMCLCFVPLYTYCTHVCILMENAELDVQKVVFHVLIFYTQ